MRVAEGHNLGVLHGVGHVFGRLPKTLRRTMGFYLLGLLLAALLETALLAVIALTAATLSDPQAILSSSWLSQLHRYAPQLVPPDQRQLVIFVCLTLVLLALGKNLFQLYLAHRGAILSSAIDALFGRLMLTRFFTHPYEWHLGHNSADLILAIQWREFFGSGLVAPVIQITGDMLVILCMLSTFIWVEPAISLAMGLVLGLAGVAIYLGARHRLDQATKSCRTLQMSINRNVTKSLHGIKDVLISGHEAAFLAEYDAHASPLVRIQGQQGYLGRLPVGVLELAGITLIAAVIFFMVLHQGFSKARVTVALTFIAITAWRILPAVGRILGGWAKIRKSMPYISGLSSYLEKPDAPPQISEPEPAPLPPFAREIVLDRVSFCYSGAQRPSLQEVSLNIGKGQCVGIIGHSGSGKSTLADLLIGLLAPSSGELRVDGRTLDTAGRRSWMRQVGYVPQAAYIFDGSLAENVAFGVPLAEIDEARVRDCCSMAAIDFLDQLAEGVWTSLGERGARLSGGQKQRVTIARALYANPSLLIFDEATSSLDQTSEQAIQETILGFMGKITMVIVAHRLSTVAQCDSVAWIDSGVVVAVGPPAKILPAYKARNATTPL